MWYLLSREQLLDRVSKTIVSPRREDAFDDLHHELIHIPLPRALMSALEVARHNACLLVPPTEGTSNHIFPAWECTCNHSRLQNAFDVSCFTINSCRRPSETKTQSATLAVAPLLICLQPRQRSPRKAPDAEDVFFFFPVFGSQACAASFS